ncbi:hypothetical protein MAMC_00089 [Methylacidimicrobium cyclopophantes]|uniref:Uncharacterized protein n=2 Tax=Methylacidimicrobium cyclopophantes TaxID=1041766 RepID=A0A5E6M5D7_9BACT|nr:hypothetical protein MAMC_00089 [Methylacidimicrobium cyclopophantes]
MEEAIRLFQEEDEQWRGIVDRMSKEEKTQFYLAVEGASGRWVGSDSLLEDDPED